MLAQRKARTLHVRPSNISTVECPCCQRTYQRAACSPVLEWHSGRSWKAWHRYLAYCSFTYCTRCRAQQQCSSDPNNVFTRRFPTPLHSVEGRQSPFRCGASHVASHRVLGGVAKYFVFLKKKKARQWKALHSRIFFLHSRNKSSKRDNLYLRLPPFFYSAENKLTEGICLPTARRVDVRGSCPPSHRHSYISLLFTFRFIVP
jgi:hypothetical protein